MNIILTGLIFIVVFTLLNINEVIGNRDTALVNKIVYIDLDILRDENVENYRFQQRILANKKEGVTYYVDKSSNSDFNSSVLIVFDNEDEIINNNTYNLLCNEMNEYNLVEKNIKGVDSYSCGIATKEVVESFNLISNQKVSIKEADRAIKISFKKIETDLEKAKREEAERASK